MYNYAPMINTAAYIEYWNSKLRYQTKAKLKIKSIKSITKMWIWYNVQNYFDDKYSNGLAQNYHISFANALEILQPTQGKFWGWVRGILPITLKKGKLIINSCRDGILSHADFSPNLCLPPLIYQYIMIIGFYLKKIKSKYLFACQLILSQWLQQWVAQFFWSRPGVERLFFACLRVWVKVDVSTSAGMRRT